MRFKFFYKARSKNGRLVTGKLEAGDRREAIDMIGKRELFLVEIKEVSADRYIIPVDIFHKRVSARELALICHQLATMTQAGIPLLQCLNILIQQCDNGILKRTLKKVTEHLKEGMSLADSLKSYPKVFPPLLINMVNSGEVSGMLDQVLNRLAMNMQKEYELIEKIKSAMTYPAAVLVVAIVSVVALLTFVIPKFISLLNSMMAPIPFATRLIVQFGSIFHDYWYLAAFSFSGVVFCYKRAITTERGRILKDKTIIKIPVIGPLIQKMIISRFCRSFSALLKSGVPVLQSLDVVKNITGNYVVIKSIEEAERSIKKGDGISLPLHKSGVFPPMVIRMIAIGEETGAVDTLLEKVADFYEKEVEELVARLSSLIEPVLIVGVGGIIGFIILSIMLPMFSMMNYIK
ncbi:type II secretion system F family protein [Pelotomaculum isophthalicicum JI]|uniref:Type II secretion system F family protein n=1 Tax=Pelotomaculum isophthalicicum JI TaxID=947010 RepID=A0A9X4H6P1_9FIRM|nr:type II secretion system F family protein [Pelotomaculum isophthalicicum]MDF9408609.1 type II secretion system F family protein [Pelotomaculum isophthalicicum JI]